MRVLTLALTASMLSGCATDMITQCTMKSVSGDPMYAVGCGAAMAVTAAAVVAGGAVLIKEAADRNVQSEPAEPLAEPSSK